MKLTQEQIEEIRKRAEAATPGPWKEDVDTGNISSGDKYVLEAYEQVYTGFNEPDTAELNIDYLQQDMDFIVNARQDIPALLAHIERLDKYIVHLGEQVESDKEVKSGYYNENKMLMQRVEELESKVSSNPQPIIGFSECDEFDELMEAMEFDELMGAMNDDEE